MFRLIKQVFIAILNNSGSLAIKYTSLNNEHILLTLFLLFEILIT